MDVLINLFSTGTFAGIALAIIPIIMEFIGFVDKKMDSWSLADHLGKGKYEISLLNLIGFILSAITSVILVLVAGVPIVYAIAGAIIIYGTEFAADKIFWEKIATLIGSLVIKFTKKTLTVSDVFSAVNEAAEDYKTKDETDETETEETTEE